PCRRGYAMPARISRARQGVPGGLLAVRTSVTPLGPLVLRQQALKDVCSVLKVVANRGLLNNATAFGVDLAGTQWCLTYLRASFLGRSAGDSRPDLSGSARLVCRRRPHGQAR